MDNNNKSEKSASGSSPGSNLENEGEDPDEPSSSRQHGQSNVEDELANFRAKWQQEIRSQPATASEKFPSKQTKNTKSNEDESKENVAKALFVKGIELEKAGKVYDAIEYYCKAVKIVPDIEFKLEYRPKNYISEEKTEKFEETYEPCESDSSDDEEDVEDEIIEEGQLYSRIQKKIFKAGSLCSPKFKEITTHISALPVEIILYILRWVVSTDLDLRSLEMFGSVCRGFYLCSRDPEIWRLTCLRIWGLNCNSTPDNYGSWRNMFIKRPRLNYNGCYISKTTYIRHGENSFQDQFYRPWHMVTYCRYLRFLPEGIVLMLTSSDEPSQCVNQLKSRQPKQPVMVGYYRLKDDTVSLVVQRQEFTKSLQNTYRKNTKKKDIDNSEQTFHMELQIQSHKTRSHVKLVWTYYSVLSKSKQGYETTCNFDLNPNLFPPLWFSRVKSFTSESDQPLD